MTVLDQIIVSVITALITALLAYFGFWRQAKVELRKEYESRFNEKKWEAYLSYINLVPMLRELNVLSYKHNLYLQHKGNNRSLTIEEDQRSENLSDTFSKLSDKVQNEILLIGSPEVVKAFFEWNRLINYAEEEANSETAVNVQVKLINLMRDDLGLSKSHLDIESLDGSYFISDKLYEKITAENQRYLNKLEK
jgi:hypothetical protein